VAAGAVVAALALVATGIVLLSGGSGRTRPPAPGAISGVRIGATVENVGNRPNAIAIAGGTVWVSSAPLARVTRLDARTGRKLADAPVVGRTVVAMAPAGGGVWTALARPGRVVQLAADGSPSGATVRLPGDPTAIGAAGDAVWVAVRGRGGGPDVLLRYDPATRRRTARIEIRLGARALAAVPGGVWIAHRATPTVGFLDGRTRRERVTARLRQPAYALTFGAGHAWASLRTDDTIARIDPRTAGVVSIAAPRRPMQLAVAGNRVLVAGYVDHGVGVIDPEAARPIGRPLPAGLNPFAVAGDGRHVWVTSVGTNSVTRFDVG